MSVLLHDLGADHGVGVVERRQAVHELRLPVAGRRRAGSALTWYGRSSSTRSIPDVLGLAHRDPHVGVDEVDAGDGLGGVVGDGDPGAGARRRSRRRSSTTSAGGCSSSGPHEAHVGAHERAHDQQRAAHVEPAVAHEGVGELVVRLVRRLVHGQEVGEHLRRVPLVGEPVVDGHAGVPGQLLDVGLGVAAELDGVVHAARAPGRCRRSTPCGRAASRSGRGR